MVDVKKAEQINRDFLHVLETPERWGDFLDQISAAFRAPGVILQPAVPRPDYWRNKGSEEACEEYVVDQWYEFENDPYKRTIERHLKGLVSTDNNVFLPGERERNPYINDFLKRHRLGAWMGAPVIIDGDLYSLSFHAEWGATGFDQDDERAVLKLANRISEVATLSARFGKRELQAVTNSLEQIGQPALALDLSGRVLSMNAAAEALMDKDLSVSQGYLRLGDRRAAAQLDTVIQKARWHPDGTALQAPVIVIRREDARPILVQVSPLDGLPRSYFLGARLLLVLRDIGATPRLPEQALRTLFGLTAAEARLAARLARGEPISEAAGALAISRETARTQAKTIYGKLGVGRQSELAALLISLPL